MELIGLFNYLVFFATLAGIYAVLTLGLNVHWGYTGTINLGVGAFFAVGAYATAILTSPPDPGFIGGFGLPFLLGAAAAMVTTGVLAFLIGLVTVNLRTDYLAIATIGIAEIVRLALKNEAWLTNGVQGIDAIPRLFAGSRYQGVLFLGLVVLVIALVYFVNERAYRAPWGRVLRAIRDSESAAASLGKDILRFRLQGFVIGSMAMGLGGALYAHFVGFISPEAFLPELATFLVWVMLIAGGSGNNRGAVLGAFAIWGVWSVTDFAVGSLPPEIAARAGALRLLLVGILLEVILIARPQGLLAEKPPKPIGAGER